LRRNVGLHSGQNDVPTYAILRLCFHCSLIEQNSFRAHFCFYQNLLHEVVAKSSQLFILAFLAILPQSACAMCNEIVTTFLIEKPTAQGMARPCFRKWGSSN
jgi:hypothetical protein